MTISVLMSYLTGLAIFGWGALLVKRRLSLSLAKYPSLTGHPRMAKRIARLIPGYFYSESRWYRIDNPPEAIAEQRRSALARLGSEIAQASPITLEATARAKPMISDLQFTSNYRVPFQFRTEFMRHIQLGGFWQRSDGVWVTDLDGNRFMDITGSYGVNLFGLDFYKELIAQGSDMVCELGPLLGGYHPCVLDNIQRLCAISGMDEVSFHMSGTEAVMQAVRLARYHTGRRRLVRFSGAYHGWWDDVQPGPGNPMPPSRDTLTLREMHDATLNVLRERQDIACVLVNPIQAMHPNQAAPSDSTMIDGARKLGFNCKAYMAWLKSLRAVCDARGIVLIMDEVFLGFRLAPGGAQEYFGVRADLVTYGKTLGGGLPVGVLCGRQDLMKRFKDTRSADLCFARGTFNAHPYVMGAMNAFLRSLDRPEIRASYADSDARFDARRAELNRRLSAQWLPLMLVNMGTVWVVRFEIPSRYHWLLQFYLRREGILLSWVGTGRLIFTLNFSESDFSEFSNRFIRAATRMKADGWWWIAPDQTGTKIRKSILQEIISNRLVFGRHSSH